MKKNDPHNTSLCYLVHWVMNLWLVLLA